MSINWGMPHFPWMDWSNSNFFIVKSSGWWFGTSFFPFSWEFHHLNWRTPSFFRGVGRKTTNQSYEIHWTPQVFCDKTSAQNTKTRKMPGVRRGNENSWLVVPGAFLGTKTAIKWYVVILCVNYQMVANIYGNIHIYDIYHDLYWLRMIMLLLLQMILRLYWKKITLW